MKQASMVIGALVFVAGSACAQSGVTLYGVADIGLKYDNGAAGSATWSVVSGQRLGSRIGLRGSEDLGEGTRLVFTLESGISLDDGALGNGGRLFGRQAWIGVEGRHGAIHVGRQYSATYLALRAVDPFKNQEAGDIQRIYGYGIARTDPLSRADNAITYTTPVFRGLTARVGHKFGEGGAGQAGASSFAGLFLMSDAFQAHASWQESERVPLAAQAALVGQLAGRPGLAAPVADVRNAFAGLVYRLGALKLHAGVGAVRLSASRQVRTRSQLAGASAPLWSGTLSLSWNRNRLEPLPEGVADQFALGYAYPLSKRTEFHTSASRTRNGQLVALNSVAPGRDAHEFRLGIAHSF